MASFAYVVEGPPVSLNAKDHSSRRYQKWIRTVRKAAADIWPTGSSPRTEDLVVSIYNYFTLAPPDVDNIIKPILDGMETVVYNNDSQVFRVLSERVNLSLPTSLIDPAPLVASAQAVYTEFLYVVVTWTEE